MAEISSIDYLGSNDRSMNRKNETSESKYSVMCNALYVFIALLAIIAEIFTDILVIIEYWKKSNFYWALVTGALIVLPIVIVQIFSLRWLLTDKKANVINWILHFCLLGVFERYIIFFKDVSHYKKCVDKTTKVKYMKSKQNEIIILHLFHSSIGSIPQIIVQIYSIITFGEDKYIRVYTLCTSTFAVSWAILQYTYNNYSILRIDTIHWLAFPLKIIWHFGMLLARIAAIVLLAALFGKWILIPLGVHWAVMTIWLILQKTSFCPTKMEEILYNFVVGFIYCFHYINPREGQTRYRLLKFYTLITLQNFSSIFLCTLVSNVENQQKSWSIIANISVVVGTVLGLSSMILYYRYFHPSGPIKWKHNHIGTELNNKSTLRSGEDSKKTTDEFNQIVARTLKARQSNEKRVKTTPQAGIVEFDTTDKKLLLAHWIGRSGTPTFMSSPVSNNELEMTGIEIHTVNNTPQSVTNINSEDFNFTNNGKLKFGSPSDLKPKLLLTENIDESINDITSSNAIANKRRAICSSDDLKVADLNVATVSIESSNDFRIDLPSSIVRGNEESQKKSSSGSVDFDLDLSFSDINSSDINSFNENIVQKLCLSALKNIKVGNQDADIENIQRIALDILKEMYEKKGKHIEFNKDVFTNDKRDADTSTEVMSVHDYENICAVNIAREAWGLRSWSGYCDIENWVHDGSVVRDRRRDTFTSGSSEISSYVSQELNSAMLSSFNKYPIYSNVQDEKNDTEHYASSAVIESEPNINVCKEQKNPNDITVKPSLVDFANQLEPILEELDDLGDLPNKKRLNSESSLVATIDEIRKITVSNSPRNVYHRRQYLLDSPQLNTSNKNLDLKHALWKEPYKFHPCNIMDSFSEKENIKTESLSNELKPNKKETTGIPNTTNNSQRNSTKRHAKIKNIRTQVKKNNSKIDDIYDLCNKDIDLLWQLVADNNIPLYTSPTDSFNDITSSLQSLIAKKDSLSSLYVNVTPASQKSKVKRGMRNRPRRKFSILREKFEPKEHQKSHEEALYQNSRNVILSQQNDCAQSVLTGGNDHRKKSDFAQIDKRLNILGTNMKLTDKYPTYFTELGSSNIKERRSLFMNSVLSPPKFNTKLKYKI